MYGLLVKVKQRDVCIYNECVECQQHCLKKVLFFLKRARIQPISIDESHSVVLRFTNPVEAWQALAVMEQTTHMKGKIMFQI